MASPVSPVLDCSCWFAASKHDYDHMASLGLLDHGEDGGFCGELLVWGSGRWKLGARYLACKPQDSRLLQVVSRGLL